MLVEVLHGDVKKTRAVCYSVVRYELTSCSSRGTLLSFNLWTSAVEAPTSRAAESKKGAFMVELSKTIDSKERNQSSY